MIIDDVDECGAVGGMSDREIEVLETTCPSAALSTTNPT
jgi:hypothetical protein